MAKLPWTHYVDEERADRFVHVFIVGECETCHGAIEEPNAAGIPRHAALGYRLTNLRRRLPESGHNEETEISDCENCRGRDLCEHEHGHDPDFSHPCIDCALEKADALGDMRKEGTL